jgi:hypothetical protein
LGSGSFSTAAVEGTRESTLDMDNSDKKKGNKQDENPNTAAHTTADVKSGEEVHLGLVFHEK